MKKIKLKTCIILSVISLFTIIVRAIWVYQIKNQETCYEKDYFGKVGLPESHLYKSVVEKMGEPLRIEETEDGYIVYYNGLEFAYGSIETGAIKYVKVTGKQYRFGMWRIGVGSTRKKVESVYRHKIQWSTDTIVQICEGETWVKFEFDENNIVKAIYIALGWA
ncbi:MAG: hypothetical protein Q4B84_05135 [Clostridia bacterium]|nr:hypothetical protein [Clostridia bacterium]